MGYDDKHEKVLAAILASQASTSEKEKDKRTAWKLALSTTEMAYSADVDAALQGPFGYSTEMERKDAFKNAFSKLYDAVARNPEKWRNDGADIPGFLKNSGEAYLKSMCQKVQDAPEDTAIVRDLQNGSEDALRRVYGSYRDYFIKFAGKQFPKADLDTVTDVYQDAWIVIIKYITDQKIRVVPDGNGGEWLIGLRNKATIKTLLTAIGINMLKKDNGDDLTVSLPETGPDLPDLDGAASENFSEEDHELLYLALEKLNERCKFLLACRYWIKFSYKEIQDWTDAPSEEALRIQVNRCKKYLIRAFKDIWKGE